MSDLAERVRAVGEQVDAGYDARRTEEALSGLNARLGRRRTRRIALGSGLAALCLLASASWALRTWQASHGSRAQHRAAPAGALFALADGSVVMPLDSRSRVVAKSVSPRLVELELLAGSAHFDVAPNHKREFHVSAGRVGITVVGTRFSVERLGERTVVAVEGGRVRVEWERGQQILDPGERGTFPPMEKAAEETGQFAPTPEPEAPTLEPRAGSARAAADWRALANHGEFTAAYRLLHDQGKAMARANLDDLLLAADVARRAGHAADSVPYLEKALATHAGDARSAVVAFTLGRVRLADLHDPAGAAAAFARARAAAPRGPLAEDALAREVEARFRSGDRYRARALAEEYVETWPAGAHLNAVRHFGGLP